MATLSSTRTSLSAAPVLFPCLLCAGDVLFQTPRDEFLKFHCSGHAGETTLIMKFIPGPHAPQAPAWLLDRTGSLRELQLTQTRQAWATGLRWLWDFTRAECDIAPPQSLTAAGWLQKLAAVKGRPSFPVAGHLRAFLKKLPPDETFGEKQFAEFWRQSCYPLKPEQWREQYP